MNGWHASRNLALLESVWEKHGAFFVHQQIIWLQDRPPFRRKETGGPGETRTPDLRFRKPLLYPTELQALAGCNPMIAVRFRQYKGPLQTVPEVLQVSVQEDGSPPVTVQIRQS